MTPPDFKLDELLSLADEQNPQLRSLRARQDAATWSVRAARSEFLPTLSVQAGWSGFTQEYTDENVLVGQTLSRSQFDAAHCHYDNQVKTALNLGGQVADCFGAFGLNSTGTALNQNVESSIRDATTSSLSTTPASRSAPTSRSRCPSSPASPARSRVSQARAQELDADEDVRAGQASAPE